MPAIDVVPIPDNVLTSIQMMIETTPHENVADRLAEILSMIQIAQARMRDCTSIGFRGIVNFRENLGSYLIDFGAIYAITSSLFVYSRNKISFDSEFNMQPLHYNKILDSFLSFDMHSAAYDELKDQVRGMAEAEITANSL